jgi:hypothetical protein
MKVMKNTTLLKRAWKSALAPTCLAMWLLAPTLGSPPQRQGKSWNLYYPLAKDNTWRYTLIHKNANKPQEFVTWRVLNSSSNSQGTVFAVWPIPAESDDEGMQLQFTHEGLKEVGNDFYVLRFPLNKGANWSSNSHGRVFTVLSEGEPCAVGTHKFSECTVIQDDDHGAKLRTLTTYAFGVGPVRYEYHGLEGGGAENQATQTMEIVSYSIKPSSLPKSPRQHTNP